MIMIDYLAIMKENQTIRCLDQIIIPKKESQSFLDLSIIESTLFLFVFMLHDAVEILYVSFYNDT